MNVLCKLLSRPRTTSDATLEVTCPALTEGIVDYMSFLLSTLLTLSTSMTSQLVHTLTNSLHHQMLPPGPARRAWAKGRVDEFVCLLHTQLATRDTDVAIVGSTQELTLYHIPPSIYDSDTLEECMF